MRDDRCRFADRGLHTFEYSISPFTGIAEAYKRAAVLNSPLRTVYESFHRGSLPLKYEGFSIKDENIFITAVKKSEDNDKSIVRCLEVEGKDTSFKLELFGESVESDVKAYGLTTLNEEGKKLDLMEWEV